MGEPNVYREGYVNHELVRLMKNINEFLEGKTTIGETVRNGRVAWVVRREVDADS